MKQITLKQLNIQNFKGIAAGSFAFNGNTDITADVQQGKSSLKDAYLFALGIDIENFYPIDKNNQYIDNVKTFVELVLSVNDLEYSLSRSAVIKYKVDKETGVQKFDGFKKDIFSFDQIPCTSGKYKDSIVELFGVPDFPTLKVLSILNYFNEEISWKERRQLLYNLYVDKTQIEKINSDQHYDLLNSELLKGKTSADISTLINSENRRIQDEKTRNKILLEDYMSNLEQFQEHDFAELESQLQQLEKQIQDFSTLESIEHGKIIDEIANVQEARAKAIENETREKNSLSEKITKHEIIVSRLKQEGIILEDNIRNLANDLEKTRNLTFDESLTLCPTCHQTLPFDQIDKIKTEWINAKESKISSLVAQISSSRINYEKLKKEYTTKQSLLHNFINELKTFASSPDIALFDKKLASLYEKLDNTKSKNNQEKIEALNKEKVDLLGKLSLKDSYIAMQEKITKLKESQKELVNAEIMVAKKRKQLEEYTLDIIKTINDSINSHFNGIRFKLFETLTVAAKKDIKETLIVLSNGVDYGACSTGQKAETNMLIISTLQKTLGVSLPIWVDDASITNFNYLPQNQMIFLYNKKGAKLNCSKIRDIY